jgi:hypothetical protein
LQPIDSPASDATGWIEVGGGTIPLGVCPLHGVSPGGDVETIAIGTVFFHLSPVSHSLFMTGCVATKRKSR